MSTPVVAPPQPPEPPKNSSKVDEVVRALIKEIGPWRLVVAGLVALVAVLAAILGLAAIVVPYLAAAGAFGVALGGLATLVRACRSRS